MTQPNRRDFIKTTSLAAAGLSTAASFTSQQVQAHPRPSKDAVSLATWSIVRSFDAGVWKLTDIHRICREDFGIDGVEYVTKFFESPVNEYLKQLNKNSHDYNVQNVLIMVDGEGSMVAHDKAERMQAAINHRKWVEIAAVLGCHAIRCNAHGGGKTRQEDPDSIDRAAESFSALIEYAEPFQINVIIENHGGLSSDPTWLPDLAKKIGSPHFGLLPDYGNYSDEGELDVYKAVEMAMPYAKGVSVKAGWRQDGTHPQYDIARLLKISKNSGFTGFWGIESGMAGNDSQDANVIKENDWKAVKLTKAIVDKVIFGKA